MSTTEDVYYDPYDFEIDADPYPVWKRMRDTGRCTTTRSTTSTPSPAGMTSMPG